jgi:hypothetical protein
VSDDRPDDGMIGLILAHECSDLGWFAASGMCGHCGNDPEGCSCAGSCGCWPHDREVIGYDAVYDSREPAS